jgi:hypothetical protein
VLQSNLFDAIGGQWFVQLVHAIVNNVYLFGFDIVALHDIAFGKLRNGG